MTTTRFTCLISAVCTAIVIGAGVAVASDHKDAPYTQEHPMSDIGDAFVFQGNQTGGLAMSYTLNPLSGSGAPGSLSPDKIKLDPKLIYMFKLDMDDDAVADVVYKIKVEDIAGEDQKQKVMLRRAEGKDALRDTWDGTDIGAGFTTALNEALEVTKGKDGELLFVGPRRDPFFFDFTTVQAPAALAIKQALAGGDHLPAKPTSLGAFGKTDMSLIVLEVPGLEATALNFWTVVAEDTGKSVDRMGRAGVQGIFFVDPPVGYNPARYLPVDPAYKKVGEMNDAYNATDPKTARNSFDGQFKFSFERLEVLDERMDATVDFYASDMIRWDMSKPAGYPNGRTFAEDAIFWTIKDVNPFFFAAEGSNLPKSSDQNLNLDKFPYAAPSIDQKWKDAAKTVPVAPIYMD